LVSRRPVINAIGTAVPDHDIHHAFVNWATSQLADPREAALFARMSARSGIEKRWSVLPRSETGGSPVDAGGFYDRLPLPPTSERMAHYAHAAPVLALRAIAALAEQVSLDGISHLVVASCTGFVAPGIDQIIATQLGLRADVERLLIGFMGCYAAVTALKAARHIVMAEPDARVLVVTVELSTLHLQPETRLEPMLAMLQFGDGAAAALVTGAGAGLALEQPYAMALAGSADLIRWTIGDHGFAMHLSGEVPGRIRAALRTPDMLRALTRADCAPVTHYAIHAGGRSILDAVSQGLDLRPDALDDSRATLREYGNLSSATLMFVLARMPWRPGCNGIAMAFGPGLAAEGFHFTATG
jgi:predicted naringenin-chalcone synthase